MAWHKCCSPSGSPGCPESQPHGQALILQITLQIQNIHLSKVKQGCRQYRIRTSLHQGIGEMGHHTGATGSDHGNTYSICNRTGQCQTS